MRAFPRYCFAENTQLSPSLTRKLGSKLVTEDLPLLESKHDKLGMYVSELRLSKHIFFADRRSSEAFLLPSFLADGLGGNQRAGARRVVGKWESGTAGIMTRRRMGSRVRG